MKQDKFRCHFSIVFENLGSAFWFIAMCFITQIDNLDDMVKDIRESGVSGTDTLVVSLILVAVLVLVFLYHVIIWSKTWISIEEDAVVIEKRTLNRKNNTIGMKNISNINIEQNLFERLVGTYKVKLDTNSKSTADATDVKIVLSKENAMHFKKQVMLHMNKDGVKEDETVLQEEYDVSYSPKEIILHCCYTASIISVLILLGVVIGAIVGIRSLHTGALVVDSLVNVIGSMLAILLIVISVFQSLVKDFFIYYGFRAKRRGNKIYLCHGLLKSRQYAMAVDKINAIQVVSTTFSRLLGRQYVKVICVGVGDENNENSMILLSETKEQMQEKMGILLPEFALEEQEIIKREKKSVYSEIPGMLIFSVILIVAVVLLSFVNIPDISSAAVRIFIIVLSISIIGAACLSIYMNFKTCGISPGENVLMIANGTFTKTVTWIPYHKIQQIEYTQGPICRRFGLAKGIVFVLAKMMDSMYEISYFKLEVYETIREKILVRQGMK